MPINTGRFGVEKLDSCFNNYFLSRWIDAN